MSHKIPWRKPKDVEIQIGKMYLVWTNGQEWRDNHIHLWPAPMVSHNLKPEIIRGKILWIAEVTEP